MKEYEEMEGIERGDENREGNKEKIEKRGEEVTATPRAFYIVVIRLTIA